MNEFTGSNGSNGDTVTIGSRIFEMSHLNNEEEMNEIQTSGAQMRPNELFPFMHIARDRTCHQHMHVHYVRHEARRYLTV